MDYFKRLYIRFRYWEFWPTWAVYLPVLLLFPFWCLRCRTCFWFAAVNPNVEMGGLYGASKYGTLKLLPEHAKPPTLRFSKGVLTEDVLKQMRAESLDFPVVIKPDFGERGQGVDLIHDRAQLEYSLKTQSSDFILQSYLDMPVEAGVFFIRHPSHHKGVVPSLVIKGFLNVIGNGQDTVETLALKNKRAFLVWDGLQHNLSVSKDIVLPKNEVLVLEPIGNHSRGTAFNDGNHLIAEALVDWANRIATELPGFYYGRFDVRAPSIEDLVSGKNIKIMEVNGANAEPAHIYQEGASIWTGWATLISHWNQMSTIARYNLRAKSEVNFSVAYKHYKQWRSIKKEKWDRMPKSC